MGPVLLAQDIGSKWIYWPWVGDHLDEIRTRLAEHITLTFWAVFLGFVIAFPLALPAIVAGIRIATVTTIGLITVTALIGQGGLGQFMIDGFQRDFRTPLTVGIVLSVALAVVADLLLVGTQRLVSPWARAQKRKN